MPYTILLDTGGRPGRPCSTTTRRPASTVILERLRKDGYRGGKTILKDFIQRVRPEFLAAQGYQRTTYASGEIGHTDWWEPPERIPVGKGRDRKTYGLVTTLPHSSAHAVVFSFHKTIDDFFKTILGGLKRLGSVPDKDRLRQRLFDHRAEDSAPPAKLHAEVAALFGSLRTEAIVLDPIRRDP